MPQQLNQALKDQLTALGNQTIGTAQALLAAVNTAEVIQDTQAPPPPPPPSDVVLPDEIRPYSESAPWYLPIPADASTTAISSTVQDFTSALRASAQFDLGGESPTYWLGEQTNPIHTVTVGAATFRFYAPADLRPGTGSDAPIIVYNRVSPDHGPMVAFRVWKLVSAGTNKWTGSGFGITRYGKDQLGIGHAFIGSNTGSGCSYDCGKITAADFLDDAPITHAMRVACRLSSRTFQWPAIKSDGGVGRVIMGARLRIDPSWDVSKIQVPGDTGKLTWAARKIAKACQDYGVYVLDSGSGGTNWYGSAGPLDKQLLGKSIPELLGPPITSTYRHVIEAMRPAPWVEVLR